jgi:hypothetical protein
MSNEELIAFAKEWFNKGVNTAVSCTYWKEDDFLETVLRKMNNIYKKAEKNF